MPSRVDRCERKYEHGSEALRRLPGTKTSQRNYGYGSNAHRQILAALLACACVGDSTCCYLYSLLSSHVAIPIYLRFIGKCRRRRASLTHLEDHQRHYVDASSIRCCSQSSRTRFPQHTVLPVVAVPQTRVRTHGEQPARNSREIR